MSNILYIRPSGILAHDDCPSKYDRQYRQKVRSEATSINLPFGTAAHDAGTGYIGAWVRGQKFDPEKVFLESFEQKLDSMIIEVPASKSIKDYREIGRRLAGEFPAAWEKTGLDVLLDANGDPLIERPLQYAVREDIVLTGTPDLGVVDEEGNCGVLDLKTPASASDPIFLEASEQLTSYQLLVEANADALAVGGDGVNYLAFMEGLKRKAKPEWLQPHPTTGRGKPEKDALIQKMIEIKKDHDRGYFPKRPRMAYNTPCTMCDFRAWCHHGDTEGLVFNEAKKGKAEPIRLPKIA